MINITDRRSKLSTRKPGALPTDLCQERTIENDRSISISKYETVREQFNLEDFISTDYLTKILDQVILTKGSITTQKSVHPKQQKASNSIDQTFNQDNQQSVDNLDSQQNKKNENEKSKDRKNLNSKSRRQRNRN